ncbi:ATP-dependent endonuclease [Streptomyces sp. NBC_00237]|uniref:ATP-dependent endonuclease n=1 Tax=Streptomyces sp. NBC_00237 TaxID=2975687 RepID=UPI00224CD469|nr:ATP-dependent endonuclease [Streptomyces sp. NBC_00237]MCX5202932.1 ATP-dependent endonuclease [Streptomyces sp. NBC_00237]
MDENQVDDRHYAHESGRFRAATVAWAAGGPGADAAADIARELARTHGPRTVVLVEGISDRAALEALAVRRGRDLDAEGVCVVPLGGATSIGRFLVLLGPQGLGLRLCGLCDAAETGFFRRALERAGLGSPGSYEELERLGFYVCDADLEDELIRALGCQGVEEVAAAQGDLRSLRTFRNQPAQRPRTTLQQLRRFMGTTAGRKESYARAMVDALDLDRVPRPLDALLAAV